MQIVVEGTTWTNRRGYGRFLREILSAALRIGTRGSPLALWQAHTVAGLLERRGDLRLEEARQLWPHRDGADGMFLARWFKVR